MPRADDLQPIGDLDMASAFALPVYPVHRARRTRQHPFIRNLVRETQLTAAQLILPIFLIEGQNQCVPINAMPGVMRHSIDQLPALAAQCIAVGIQAVALFPVLDSDLKDPQGSAALASDSLIIRATQCLKKNAPQLGVIADIALDPYTSHGQDGLIDTEGRILNDETVAVLVQQALIYAQAGVDIVAPSDMMDGRIGAIRQALEKHQAHHTQILAYAAKYASCFYGPFRDAVGSAQNLGKADKASYQMDPGNSNEALREAALDIQEGADIVMVKPGMPYLDILWRVKQELRMPTFVYQVSGEYSMIKAAAQQGWLDERASALEALLCLRRAGADAILSYFALEAAQWLNAAKR